MTAEPLCEVCDHSRYGHVDLHTNHPYTPRHSYDADCWCDPTVTITRLPNGRVSGVYIHHIREASLVPKGTGARTESIPARLSPVRLQS